MQQDNIYEIKEKKKDNNLITLTQSRVPNNTKIYQFKVEMQENIKIQKYKDKKLKERKREK